jgi:flagellar protein FliJ
MARFVFQLEGVLRHRRNVEKERQRQMAVVQAAMQQLEVDRQKIEQEVKDSLADLRDNRLVGPIDLSYLAAHRRFIMAMQRKATQVAQRMALVQRQLDDARAALAEAAKQRKIIEKLRDKQFARWTEDRNAKEARELDEIGMQLTYGNAVDPTDRSQP